MRKPLSGERDVREAQDAVRVGARMSDPSKLSVSCRLAAVAGSRISQRTAVSVRCRDCELRWATAD